MISRQIVRPPSDETLREYLNFILSLLLFNSKSSLTINSISFFRNYVKTTPLFSPICTPKTILNQQQQNWLWKYEIQKESVSYQPTSHHQSSSNCLEKWKMILSVIYLLIKYWNCRATRRKREKGMNKRYPCKKSQDYLSSEKIKKWKLIKFVRVEIRNCVRWKSVFRSFVDDWIGTETNWRNENWDWS